MMTCTRESQTCWRKKRQVCSRQKRRLRFNRSALIAYRLQRASRKRERELLSHYCEIVELLEQLYDRQTLLTQEQQQLLKQQRELLQLLLRQKNSENN